MNVSYRLLLAIAALLILLVMLRKIRKSEVKISDSLFWFFFVITLIILALFPEIAYFLSNLLGIESPANLVFLYVIALLLMREFASTVELSRLRSKLAALAQSSALNSMDADRDADRQESGDA